MFQFWAAIVWHRSLLFLKNATQLRGSFTNRFECANCSNQGKLETILYLATSMFKKVGRQVWAFDLEWVPDPIAGRAVYNLPSSMSDEEVYQEMWRRGGATEEDPQPYLKTILCRIVSIAVVCRKGKPGEEKVGLTSLPKAPYDPMDEKELIQTVLGAIGDEIHQPQLVGFNSKQCDLPILIQRGIALGVTAPDFCRRPNKPWEGIDYFHQYGDDHVDLKDIVGGWGKAAPSLHELAQTSGIPGKMGTDGGEVFDLWKAGKVKEIVTYNQCDALTTYLVWLRTAFFAGHLDQEEYEIEQAKVKDLLTEASKNGEAHLGEYLQRWKQLQAARTGTTAIALNS